MSACQDPKTAIVGALHANLDVYQQMCGGGSPGQEEQELQQVRIEVH